MYRRNASASSVDPVAASELAMFATNDGDLYSGQGSSIILNLAKKMAKGQYDVAKAVKLWGYFADSAAKKYAWEFGDRKRGTRSWYEQSVDGNGMFNAATRRAAAAEIEESFREEVQHKAAASTKARKNGGKATMASIRAANAAAGQHFFSRATNKFFASKVVAGPYGGRFFVTEEKSGFDPRSARRYTVREAVNGGASIKTVGEFNGFMLKEDAVDMARAMAASTEGASAINAALRNPRATAKPYNGHPSWAHWNVALWVANDYGLYQAVSRMKKDEAVDFLMHRFPRTPDGAKMTKTLAAYAWRSLKD